MMGRTHALTGIAAGLATGPVIGLTSLAQLVPYVLVTTGYALLPDLDHPTSTASRSLGPVTRAVSWVLRRCSALLYAATKGPRDEACTGTHRHATHTVVFALVLGGAAAAGGSSHPLAVAGIVAFAVLLGTLVLGEAMLVVAGVGALLFIAGLHGDLLAAGPALAAMSWKIGVAVIVGCVTHCLGDAVTESGCPFLFPIPIAGETWYEIRPPKWLRFTTDSGAERVGVTIAVGLLNAWLLVRNVFPLVFGGAA
jgi:membrane-bound metal-dependent hydrolase YbcI (DUF457 family)